MDPTQNVKMNLEEPSANASLATLATRLSVDLNAPRMETAHQALPASVRNAKILAKMCAGSTLSAMSSTTHPGVLVLKITLETRTHSATRGLKSSHLRSQRTKEIPVRLGHAAPMPSVKQLATEQSAPANLDFKAIHL